MPGLEVAPGGMVGSRGLLHVTASHEGMRPGRTVGGPGKVILGGAGLGIGIPVARPPPLR